MPWRRGHGHGRGHSEDFQEEKRLCAQALLNRPWITKAEDPELFEAVRNHFGELRDWFRDQCGFTLLLTRQLVKLEKVPGRAYPWMGFSEFATPRDYALFTFSLWYLEDKNENDQFLLSEMVEEIRDHIRSLDGRSSSVSGGYPAGIPAAGASATVAGTAAPDFDLNVYDHRMSLARALKKLRDLGVLVAVDGDEMEWARTAERDILYECSHLARYVLRRFAKDLPSYNTIASLAEGVYPDTQEGEIKRRRHQIYRRLVEEPAVLDAEWPPAERAYVLMQRHAIQEQLRQALGLEGSRYREGLLFFYPELTGEMALFPTAKAVSDICLCLAGELRRRLAENDEYAPAPAAGAAARPTRRNIDLQSDGTVVLSLAEFEGLLARLRERYSEFWSGEHRRMTTAELARAVLEHLEQWKLGWRQDEQTLTLSPVLARWNGDYGYYGDCVPTGSTSTTSTTDSGANKSEEDSPWAAAGR